METPTAVHLLDVFRASGLWSDALTAAADGLAATDDLAALADQLWPLGALTRYQYAKIRNGRVEDIVFGPYLVLDKIGEGGMGKVFKAVELDKRRMVALKTIRPQLMTNKTVLKRYEREAQAAQALNHPNVVTMYDAAEVNGRFVLAMEFVEGVDLSRLVKEYGRPPEFGLSDYQEACEYVRQSALGLQAAHDLGFVHRDIKPSNMLVSGERSLAGTGGKALVKVLDMGLVRQMLESEDATKTELTRDGTVVGTPDYMAPEQAKNSSTVDHRADLYSLGCTLYFLLRGSPPFPDGSPLDKLIRHQLDAPPDLRPLRPDVPEAVHQVMERLLKKKPGERYGRAADVAAALAPFTPGGSGGHAASPIQPSYAPFSLAPDPPAAATPVSSPSATAAPSGITPKGPRLRAITPPPATTAHPTPASGTTATPRMTPVVNASATRPGGVRLVPAGPMTPVTDAHGPISGPLTAKIARAATPVSTPKPKPPQTPPRRPGKPARRKSRGVNPLYWAAGGLVVAGGFVLGFLAVKPSNKSGSAQTLVTTPTTAPTGPAPAYPHLPPAARMFPPGTVAAVAIYPQPLWKAAFELPVPPTAKARLEELVKRVRFDTKSFDRVCVSFTAKAGHYVAVGEGPVLTLEWAAETEARLGGKPDPASGPGGKVYKLDPKAGPNLAAVAPGSGYAVSNDHGLLAAWVKSFGPKPDPTKVAAEVSRDLVKAFPPPTDADLPVATFAATGSWSLPVPNAATLDRDGVRFAAAEVRWADGKFHVTLTLTGPDEADLKDFIHLELAKQLADRYPSLRPVVARLASTIPAVDRAAGEVTVRLAASFTWSEAAAAVDLLIPVGAKKPG